MTAASARHPNALPHPWVWSNYAAIATSSIFWQAVANSVVVAVVATGLAMTFGSMAAFALSRYTFRGREAFYLLFVAGLLFPLNTAALPLSRPALITVGILAFVTSWNAYLLPLVVFSSQDHYTLPLAVANFQSTYTQDTARVYAFTAVSMIPALAIFIFAQRKLVGGLVGAIRG